MCAKLVESFIEENTGWIELNNTRRKNAVNNEMYEQISLILDKFENEESVRSIVIRGRGGNFSAGFDLTQGLPESYRDFVKKVSGKISKRLWYGPKPTISLIEGYCVGGGFELAMGSDLVYAAENAVLGEPEIDFFFTPDYNSIPCLALARKAKEMILLGLVVSGAEAVGLGLANRSFPAETIEEEVKKVCRRLASLPAETVGSAKQGLNGALDAQGFGNAIAYGEEIAIFNGLLSKTNPAAREFYDLVEKKGLKEAIRTHRDYSMSGGVKGGGWKK
jgi:enoyl-CoA hydratase